MEATDPTPTTEPEPNVATAPETSSAVVPPAPPAPSATDPSPEATASPPLPRQTGGTASDPQAQRATVLATFNKTVGDLVDELKGTFPELKESLDERYATAAAPDDTSLMDWFIANAQPHFMAITTKSETLFKENDATFLLPDINFTQLWKCKLTKATKAAIWKYLHVMLLLVSHYQLNTHDFESTFAQWNEMLDGNKGGQMDEAELQKMKAHAEQVMQLMQSLAGGGEDDAEAGSDDDEAGGDAAGGAEGADDGATSTERAQRFEKELKEDPFIQQLENSKIAQFAKELSNEIDVSSLGLSPDAKVESFQDVFGTIGKNPQRLLGLVKSVGDKIQTKLTTGDIKQSELVEEAHTLVKSMQDSKAFKQMFKKARKKGKHGGGLDPQAMFATMAKQMASMPGMEGMMGGGGPGGPGGAGGMPDPAAMQQMMAQMMGAMGGGGMGGGGGAGALARMETQERLRQKLAARQAGGEGAGAAEGTTASVASTTDAGDATDPAKRKKKRGKKKKKKRPPTVEAAAATVGAPATGAEAPPQQ